MMQERISKVYTQTRNVLNALYEKRKRTLLFQKIMWGITGIYFVWMLLVLAAPYFQGYENGPLAFVEQFQSTPSNPYGSMYPIIGLIVLLYPTTLIFTRVFQKYTQKEQEIIAKMVKTLFPKAEFTQGANAPVKEIVASKLFSWTKKESTIYSYGQMRSTADGSQINIADVGIVENNMANKFSQALMRIPILNMFEVLYQNVFKNIATNKLANNTTYTYRGMFCWLNFKKKLNGHTVLLPKNQLAQLDRWSSFNFKEEQKIYLEDPRFNDKFIVYSTDQVEARYVLSTSLMERVVTLKEKFGRPIFISFQNRQMYLAVENENGLFSFPAGKLDGLMVIQELANDIETALDISKELYLN